MILKVQSSKILAEFMFILCVFLVSRVLKVQKLPYTRYYYANIPRCARPLCSPEAGSRTVRTALLSLFDPRVLGGGSGPTGSFTRVYVVLELEEPRLRNLAPAALSPLASLPATVTLGHCHAEDTCDGLAPPGGAVRPARCGQRGKGSRVSKRAVHPRGRARCWGRRGKEAGGWGPRKAYILQEDGVPIWVK